MVKKTQKMENKSQTPVEQTQSLAQNSQAQVHFGKLIRRLMKQKNLRAKTLAEKIGLKHRSMYDLFKRKHLSTALLEKISAALNIDLLHADSSEEKQKNILLEKESGELKKEIVFLKEVIQAMRRK